ncbi:MAG: metal-sensitive transcriptional regulator [Clostridiaceae bacterium]|nr:metal-sensitive transcriptional regulator [Clostridiaceae bacterium]
MYLEDIKKKKDIINRLKRIEGQVKGIQGMMEKDSCCRDILIQVSAIRSAINKVGALMIENYAYNCLDMGSESEEEKKKLDELIRVMNTFIK